MDWGDPRGFDLLEEARSRAQAGGFAFEETRALLNMGAAAAEHRDVDLAG